MTQQLDLPQCPITDEAFRRIAEQLPKPRDVSKRRLPEMFHDEHSEAQSTSRPNHNRGSGDV